MKRIQHKMMWAVSASLLLAMCPVGLAAAARKWGAGAETSRKLVHILLSNWILLALAVYHSAWTACVLPACFILLNYISYRKGLFSAIEREENNTPGTVWYAVSLFLLCLAGYSLGTPWIAACGMLAMGYGDGLPRALSNQLEVLLGDKLCPVLGRICMDVCMVDVTDAPGVKAGDEAEIYGPGLTDWAAELAGTISYELLCQLTPRLPRIYLEGGTVIL